MFKVNNRSTITRRQICLKLIIKTPERHHWRRSGVFIVNSEHISHLVLVFLLLTLKHVIARRVVSAILLIVIFAKSIKRKEKRSRIEITFDPT